MTERLVSASSGDNGVDISPSTWWHRTSWLAAASRTVILNFQQRGLAGVSFTRSVTQAVCVARL